MAIWQEVTDKRTGRIYVVSGDETRWLWDMLADPAGNRYFFNNVDKSAVWYVERPELEKIANPKIKPEQWPKIRQCEAAASASIRSAGKKNQPSKPRLEPATAVSPPNRVIDITAADSELAPNEIRGMASNGRPYIFNKETKVSRWIPLSNPLPKPSNSVQPNPTPSRPAWNQTQDQYNNLSTPTQPADNLRPSWTQDKPKPTPLQSTANSRPAWNGDENGWPLDSRPQSARETPKTDSIAAVRDHDRPLSSKRGAVWNDDGYDSALKRLATKQRIDLQRGNNDPISNLVTTSRQKKAKKKQGNKLPLDFFNADEGQSDQRPNHRVVNASFVETMMTKQPPVVGYPIVHKKALWHPASRNNVVSTVDLLVSNFIERSTKTDSLVYPKTLPIWKLLMSAADITLKNYSSQKLSIDADIPQDEDTMEQKHVIGTNPTLQKRYLRLTSAPKPEDVRPKSVLKEAFLLLKSQWNSRHIDYPYMLDQLKSMRQDLTVQGIRDSFTVRVYETQARLALESRDVGEFNASLTQLTALYDKSGLSSASFEEFTSYRVLYALCTGGKEGVTRIMQSLDCVTRKAEMVTYAMRVCVASAQVNYVKLMSLYQGAPAMQGYLIDWFIDRERSKALQRIVKAYKGKDSVETSYLFGMLKRRMGDTNEETLDQFTIFLQSVGGKIVGNTLACKESNIEEAAITRPRAMA